MALSRRRPARTQRLSLGEYIESLGRVIMGAGSWSTGGAEAADGEEEGVKGGRRTYDG